MPFLVGKDTLKISEAYINAFPAFSCSLFARSPLKNPHSAMAQIFWMLHGISIKDNSIIIACIINLLCFSYIMYKCIINDDFDPFDH